MRWRKKKSLACILLSMTMVSIHGLKCLYEGLGGQVGAWETPEQPKTEESLSEKAGSHPGHCLAHRGPRSRIRSSPEPPGTQLEPIWLWFYHRTTPRATSPRCGILIHTHVSNHHVVDLQRTQCHMSIISQ